MMNTLSSLELLDWSRAQFALTAMYHWLFVPLTLGLGFLCAFMETAYFRTGDERWKTITKFWMKIFAINFAIGVATGLILEFQFGTNWSNYSYFVGDIFGAPLAIEGILAFFMEATFFAVMFFGWDRVSKRFHLASTWLMAIGANISAIWILVANSWMQDPNGMFFNIRTARNEMYSFTDVVFSDMSINKFIHTVTSSFLLSSVFVVSVSAWFLLKKRDIFFAKKSIKMATIFGLISALAAIWSGDISGRVVAKEQPMKFAAMEALYEGERGAGLSIIGILDTDKVSGDGKDPNIWHIEIDKMLSIMAFQDKDAFVPGIDDLVWGNQKEGIISTQEKIERGQKALALLPAYDLARKSGNGRDMQSAEGKFIPTPDNAYYNDYVKYFGYGYFEDPLEVVPNVPMVYYSFRIMVGLGMYLIFMFIIVTWLSYKDKIDKYPLVLWGMLISLPFPYLASQSGWIVTEVGRQPWTVQDMLPTKASLSAISSSAVQTTFWIFAILFTILLIAEIRIMVKQIKIGPEKIEE